MLINLITTPLLENIPYFPSTPCILVSRLFHAWQCSFLYEKSKRPRDMPFPIALRETADQTPAYQKMHLPCAFTLELDDPWAQARGEKLTENPASGKAPITGMKDMGGEMVQIPESADECTQQAPPETSRNGGHPASTLNGHGTTDDILLSQFPGIPEGVCIPPCPDIAKSNGNDTVDNALLPARRGKDDHIP
jgi:hypothetical protein